MKNKLELTILRKKLKNKIISKASFINQATLIHQRLFNYVTYLKGADISEINISPKGIIFLIGKENIKLSIPSGDKRVAPLEILNFKKKFEENARKVINLLTLNASCIFDIGANVGYYSILFPKLNSSCTVFSFEALPSSFSYLKKNIILNNFESRVFAHNILLADKVIQTNFFFPLGNQSNASMLNVSKTNKFKKIILKTLTLDLWNLKNNQKPDFIKCDTEGSELLVFRGGINIITKNKPMIYTELLRKWSKPYNYNPNDVINFFKKLGYSCYAIGQRRTKLIQKVDDNTAETNFIFLHTKKHSKVINKLDNLKCYKN